MADPGSYAYRDPEVANAYGPAVRGDRLRGDDPFQRQRLMDTSAIQAGREGAATWMPFEKATGAKSPDQE
jgi:hypothetical protein